MEGQEGSKNISPSRLAGYETWIRRDTTIVSKSRRGLLVGAAIMLACLCVAAWSLAGSRHGKESEQHFVMMPVLPELPVIPHICGQGENCWSNNVLYSPVPKGLDISGMPGNQLASQTAKMMAHTRLARKQATSLPQKHLAVYNKQSAFSSQQPAKVPVQELYEASAGPFQANTAPQVFMGSPVSSSQPIVSSTTTYIHYPDSQGASSWQQTSGDVATPAASAVVSEPTLASGNPAASTIFFSTIPETQQESSSLGTTIQFPQPSDEITTSQQQVQKAQPDMPFTQQSAVPTFLQTAIEPQQGFSLVDNVQQQQGVPADDEEFEDAPVANPMSTGVSLELPGVVVDPDTGMIEHMLAPQQQFPQQVVSLPAPAPAIGAAAQGGGVYWPFAPTAVQPETSTAQVPEEYIGQQSKPEGAAVQVMPWSFQRVDAFPPAMQQVAQMDPVDPENQNLELVQEASARQAPISAANTLFFAGAPAYVSSNINGYTGAATVSRADLALAAAAQAQASICVHVILRRCFLFNHHCMQTSVKLY
jgi:hypothetical protein